MPRIVSRFVIITLALLITFRIIGACVTALPPISDSTETIHVHDPAASLILQSFSVEKTESESEKLLGADSIGRCLLIDFTQHADSLATLHSPQDVMSPSTFSYDVRPPVHQFHCVFQI